MELFLIWKKHFVIWIIPKSRSLVKVGITLPSSRARSKEDLQCMEKTLDLDPKYLEYYLKLNIVNMYEGMKKADKKISWKIKFVDLETGNFSVVFNQ